MNMGAQMVKEVASKTNDTAGDGTTTATVLAQAIVKEGLKSVAAGMNPMDLKRGIDTAVATVVASIKEMAREVKDSAEVAQVGTISANGEAQLATKSQTRCKKLATKALSLLKKTKVWKQKLMLLKACSSTAVTCHHIS